MDEKKRFDFDERINRRGTNSEKWDIGAQEIAMWIADMDFRTAPPIQEALEKRIRHGVYGYAGVTDEWYDAYRNWWQTRHDFVIEKDWLRFTTGVIPVISSVVRRLSQPAEKVVLQTPVYNIFFNSVINNGRQVLESPLLRDDANETYHIDWNDLEEKLADPQTRLMILCNPHNPVGIQWDRETLARIGTLCEKYHVTVISDEIHCDLADPGSAYTPFAAASETCRRISVNVIAPTKAFNIAGIHTAALFIADPYLRHTVLRGLNNDEVMEPNCFAVEAAIAAYRDGGEWLDAMNRYVYENKKRVRDFIARELPKVRVNSGHATYLIWLNCRAYAKHDIERSTAVEDFAHGYDSHSELCDFIRQTGGLVLSNGEQYGTGGEYFLRMNLACPESVVEEGLQRLKTALDAFEKN